MFLTESITFLFLILNTVFAVVTGLIYKNKTILIFSFLFAYANPFLIGASADTPFSLLLYASTISIGGLILSYFYRNDQKLATFMLLASFFGGTILSLLAPFGSIEGMPLLGRYAKLCTLGIITGGSILV